MSTSARLHLPRAPVKKGDWRVVLRKNKGDLGDLEKGVAIGVREICARVLRRIPKAWELIYGNHCRSLMETSG